MNKVFLYLFPIEEYTKMFLFYDDELYNKWNQKKPLPILNECIQKRYRNNGYQVVFALYPDKHIFGIVPTENDMIIYTDVLFSEASGVEEKGNIKKNFMPKYPDEQYLLDQLSNVDELVIGGYHYGDCVRRVGEAALDNGINSLVDLDLTDLFFSTYNQNDYFNILKYDPKRYREYMIKRDIEDGEDFAERRFDNDYASPVYGFHNEENCKKR